MKSTTAIFVSALVAQSAAQAALADDFYGTIEARPGTNIGTWVVGGRSINVTEQTELDEDHGPLDVGACADVELENGVVQEIESEPAEKCSKQEFYGVIESRPDGKIGTWVVGGRSVNVTEQTEIDEDNGPLDVGACADVELKNGDAKDIESEPSRKCRH